MAEEQTYLDEDLEGFCTFCTIADDLDEEAEVIKRNEELVCFKDIFPAAPHHYLVVPRKHIRSCFSLQKEDVSLVDRMAEFGKAALQEQGVTDMVDIRLGFHRPPYTSVDHLHLHVLAPCSQIFPFLAYKFVPRSMRFVTEDCVRKCLEEGYSLCQLPALPKSIV